jgi:hypothetical protein
MTMDAVRATIAERIERGATLEELDTIVRMTRGLLPAERSALWAFAWSYEPPATALPKEPVLH